MLEVKQTLYNIPKQATVLTKASGFLGNIRYDTCKRALRSGSPESLR